MDASDIEEGGKIGASKLSLHSATEVMGLVPSLLLVFLK